MLQGRRWLDLSNGNTSLEWLKFGAMHKHTLKNVHAYIHIVSFRASQFKLIKNSPDWRANAWKQLSSEKNLTNHTRTTVPRNLARHNPARDWSTAVTLALETWLLTNENFAICSMWKPCEQHIQGSRCWPSKPAVGFRIRNFHWKLKNPHCSLDQRGRKCEISEWIWYFRSAILKLAVREW